MLLAGTSFSYGLATSISGRIAETLRSEPSQYVARTSAGSSPAQQATSESTYVERVVLSEAGRDLAASARDDLPPAGDQDDVAVPGAEDTAGKTQTASASEELTADELRMVQELRARDLEVRAHEAAHLAAAGQYASGGASFTYQQGPDGRRYAVGGEVGIDTGAEQEPEDTIQKMQVVRRAALAPANPSATDRAVAAAAAAAMAQAQRELQSTAGQAESDNGMAPASASQPDAGTSPISSEAGAEVRNRQTIAAWPAEGRQSLSLVA